MLIVNWNAVDLMTILPCLKLLLQLSFLFLFGSNFVLQVALFEDVFIFGPLEWLWSFLRVREWCWDSLKHSSAERLAFEFNERVLFICRRLQSAGRILHSLSFCLVPDSVVVQMMLLSRSPWLVNNFLPLVLGGYRERLEKSAVFAWPRCRTQTHSSNSDIVH